jgi:hypothetical protein
VRATLDGMTTPPLDHPPLRTEDDVLARVRRLVGHAVTDRQLWVMLVDGDDHQAPVVVPISDLPRHPERRGLAALSHVLAGLRAELATARGPGSVIFARERSGTDDVLPLDRAWAAALAEACRSAEVTLRGVYLSTPGGVRRLG